MCRCALILLWATWGCASAPPKAVFDPALLADIPAEQKAGLFEAQCANNQVEDEVLRAGYQEKAADEELQAARVELAHARAGWPIL
jgi:hypothetical protein